MKELINTFFPNNSKCLSSSCWRGTEQRREGADAAAIILQIKNKLTKPTTGGFGGQIYLT
jgi:hypothetical protein